MAETERTRNACIEVLRVLEHVRDVISDEENFNGGDLWTTLNATMGRIMREFENAARAELDVNGPEWPWVERRQAELGASRHWIISTEASLTLGPQNILRHIYITSEAATCLRSRSTSIHVLRRRSG